MRVVIIGAGGQSQAVMEALSFDDKFDVIGYLDDDVKLEGKVMYSKEVIGKIDMIIGLAKTEVQGAIVAIGDNEVRKKYSNFVTDLGLELINAIHPKSVISDTARLGKGIYVGPNVVIGPNVRVGDAVIVNIGVYLPHNNIIRDYVNISPNTSLGGGTIVDKETFIGIGTSVVQYVTIGCNVTVGAGSVIINDIPDYATVMGVPGKIIKLKE